MSPQDAFHHVVHDYPGSVAALAPRIGRGEQVLRNKATLDRPDGEPRSAEPTLSDVSRVNRATRDLRVIEALAAELDAVVVRLPDLSAVGDDALLDLVLTSSKEYGDSCSALREALADGEIDRLEFDRIERETLESVRAQLEVLDRVRSLVVDRPRLRVAAKRTAG